MEKQGFPEFYETLHSKFHPTVLTADYSGKVVEWPQYNLIKALLQASLLQQEKLPQHLLKDMDKVLIQFAGLLLPEDSCLGLAALLSLSKPETSEQCFSTLPLTLLTLQLAVYYLALLQTLRHHPEAFLWTPDQVLSWAMAHASEDSQLLAKALAQLAQYDHSKQVERLNCGVDVRRFAWDHQYKVDSILGLAMSEEWEKLETALNLGATHEVEGWQIVLSHLHSLLLSNSPLLPQRLSEERLVTLLVTEKELVISRMQESVLSTLSGVNHNQLINYYLVLQAVAPDAVVSGLLPRDHIKLIKKVKATSSDLDYMQIVSGPDTLAALRPAMRKETVTSVAKLLKELLKALPSLQASASVSALYSEWAISQFKSEVLNASGSDRDSLERFTALQTFLQKMSGADLLNFVRRAIFCHQSVLKLSAGTRLDMIDSVLKLCQPLHMSNDQEVLQIRHLREYLQQVWALKSTSHKSLRNYLVRLDEACGDTEAISTIIQTALVDASIPSHVLQNMANLTNRKSLSSYITDLLHSLPSHPALMTTVLQRVEDCLSRGEKGDSWSILIGPLTEKSELPTNIRKLASQISQRLGDNYSEELEALRLRTEAVLRSPVSLSQVCDLNTRYLLYKQLLSEADSWDSLHTLSLLLSTWPDVDTSWYLELIEAMADIPSDETFCTLQKIFQKNAFEEEEFSHLLSRLDGCDPIFTISVCIIPNFKRLHMRAYELLSKLPKETVLPKELAKRIVETDLVVGLVRSPIFPRLKDTLASSPELCEQVINQLVAANHLAEAEEFSSVT